MTSFVASESTLMSRPLEPTRNRLVTVGNIALPPMGRVRRRSAGRQGQDLISP